MEKKKILICGVNGQLGQHFAQYILEKEPSIDIIGTVRHKSYDKQPFMFNIDRIKLELMEITDPHSVETIISGYKPDYIVNTIANAFVGESWSVPTQHINTNTIGVLNQLEAIRKYSQTSRYFNMGTSEEFADSNHKNLQDESTILSPKSPYGVSKVAARHLIRVYRDSYNLYTIQGYTFNFESKLRGDKYVTRKISRNVARIVSEIERGIKPAPLEVGNIFAQRSWQHAFDVVDGIWRQLNQDVFNFKLNEVGSDVLPKLVKEYVLSSDRSDTVQSFIEKAFSYAGILGKWDMGNNELTPVFYSEDGDVLVNINPKFFRPNDVNILKGDSSLIRHELGWSPKYNLDDLIKEMVENDIELIKNESF